MFNSQSLYTISSDDIATFFFSAIGSSISLFHTGMSSFDG